MSPKEIEIWYSFWNLSSLSQTQIPFKYKVHVSSVRASLWSEQVRPGWEVLSSVQFSSVTQSCPTLGDPRIATHQASLSICNSQGSLKLMSIESVMPSSHLICRHPLFLLPLNPPSIRVFPMSKLFAWVGQSIAVSASASVLPMNTHD